MQNIDKTKIAIISVAVVFILGLVTFFGVKNVENRAIKYEINIEQSQGDLNAEEVRRVDLFSNLVDSIESYNDYEQETLALVVKARQQAESGNVDSAKSTLNVVVEQYPELKSQDNYKQAMKEFSITENRVASHRKSYNRQVAEYKKFTRTFVNRKLLSLQGYETQDYEVMSIPVNPTGHTDLFNK